ncbi:Pyridine nucleotide-disulfide oxidoreductase domain-containing protein 2 [Homalodisca vitripennis]|nr:Pyridine nucleotide-disulfide oxidoreductase domain-containing protein 2 [Homalodisca vitripennis]
MGKDIRPLYELMTASPKKVLNRWFESEPLRATLATDALIGTMACTDTPGVGTVGLEEVPALGPTMGLQEGPTLGPFLFLLPILLGGCNGAVFSGRIVRGVPTSI